MFTTSQYITPTQNIAKNYGLLNSDDLKLLKAIGKMRPPSQEKPERA